MDQIISDEKKLYLKTNGKFSNYGNFILIENKNSGTGVGTLAFAILIKKLIEDYGWDNNCLILSAVVLVIFMTSGILFKPLKVSKPQQIHFTELSDRCAYTTKLR